MKSTQWFYAANDQQLGPVDEVRIQELVSNHTLNAQTLVWQEGMPNWTRLQDTSLRAIVLASPTQLAAIGRPSLQAQKQVDPQSFSQLFMWFWILMAVSIPLAFFFIGVFTAIAGMVIAYILLYRYWDLIQDGNPQTTPGSAVGFCFIPFFNFYWTFIAFRGLAQDMNRYCRERAIPAPAVSEQLALWFCILGICSLIPYLNLITGIAMLIIMVILYNDFNKTAIAIIAAKSRVN